MTFACHTLPCLILFCTAVLNASGDGKHVKQPPEVIAAYRVCASFAHLFAKDLDFDRAYEATFTRDRARQRAIAIADGEFGDLDFTKIDDELLTRAYKLRMQNFYFVLPLAGPSDTEEALFFPPDIKEILKREAPHDPREFRAYVSQLARDAAHFRTHLERLTAHYPAVAERVSKFKSEAQTAKFEPPTDRQLEPSLGYYRSGVLRHDEPYYEINGYIVAREQRQMKIVGIRFFTRLF
jgi:hypothetical protein